MKRSLLIGFCLLTCAVMVFAQGEPGVIGIYSDLGFTSCNIFDDVASRLVQMYIVHYNGNYVNSSMFRLEEPPCNEMVYMGEDSPFPLVIGSTLEGISIVYPTCMGGSPIHLVTVNWLGTATTPSCCYFSIGPDPFSSYGEIEVVDCELNRMFAYGGHAIVNPVPVVCQCASPVPVYATTWGQVKALYR